MLDIQTFDNLRGGNVAYKALAHPLAAEGLARLVAGLNKAGPVSIYDPSGLAGLLLSLSPAMDVDGIYVHDTLAVGGTCAGHEIRPLVDLPAAKGATVLIAAFDSGSLPTRIGRFMPTGAALATLAEARLPQNLITHPARYLDALNFVTNFAFFRDDGRLATRLITVNYWSEYGAESIRLFLRLYGGGGEVLAQWEQPVHGQGAGIVIDSREIRQRFGLRPFTGQLFIHVVGAAGHDVVKYVLETYATDSGASLSSTHDANAWPAERYAGLPAPAVGERVILWLQNSHAAPIPPGAIMLDRMGAEEPVSVSETVPAFATRAIDISTYLPAVRWPAQIELRAARHVVRPRYEVTRDERTRIAHVNVEREDISADPGIPRLPPALGRGFLLPFPVLPRQRFRTIVQPTPMAIAERYTPLRIEIFAPSGKKTTEHYLGHIPRRHHVAFDLDEMLPTDALSEGGHAELLYDFREGGAANGWLHALFRYEHRDTGHMADSSFGAHVFNTGMTYKGEPQSYAGSPPGLSTKLFLKIAAAGLDGFCVLIYPASGPWHDCSSTSLDLHDACGVCLARRSVTIPCSGSRMLRLSECFAAADLRQAEGGGYVLIRDATCRLFGFQGTENRTGGFAFDHMFGF